MGETIFVADIGGTNARFAIAEDNGEVISLRDAKTFRALDFETVCDAASAYLEAIGKRSKRVCFAAAGPIEGGNVAFTNSAWKLRTDDIKGSLELDNFKLVNDFLALAAGISCMTDDSLISVKSGHIDPTALKLVIGPGTGFGQALLVPILSRGEMIATEGEHVTFAPCTDKELEVMRFVAREHQRISVERLLSSHGLVNIYSALCAVADTPQVSHQANEVTKAALEQNDHIATEAVDMFCALLGSVAGDAVLSTGARGGVTLGGGILPKIKDIFLKSKFCERSTDKGRMSSYLDAVPVRLLIAEGAALYGAAATAKEDRHVHRNYC
ncbi:MAG: glucokinase [Pseudomonadota bacterium]